MRLALTIALVLTLTNLALADAPMLLGQLSIAYDPATGQLRVSGQYTWSGCSTNNTARIVGYALFIDGPDADKTVADPRTVTPEALEGAGMHLLNNGQPCKTTTGAWADESHNSTTNWVLATAPTKVCVVLYDVRTGIASGNHSKIGAGANRNSDNSFEENQNAYATGTCTSVGPPPAPSCAGGCPAREFIAAS